MYNLEQWKKYLEFMLFISQRIIRQKKREKKLLFIIRWYTFLFL